MIRLATGLSDKSENIAVWSKDGENGLLIILEKNLGIEGSIRVLVFNTRSKSISVIII